MFKILKLKIAIPSLVFFLLLFVAPWAEAAVLSFEPPQFYGVAGEEFQINAMLNTEGEDINAVEGTVIFPSSLELKETSDGNSIINLWVEKPYEAKQNTTGDEGEIRFSGIIPGGWRGADGLLFSMQFLALKEGSGTMEVRDARALKNDDKGTPAAISLSSSQLVITGGTQAPPVLEKNADVDPPEAFRPEIARDPALFDGKWFLVFATQDKGSGIDYYAVHESRRIQKRIVTNRWVKAESPYVLEDQELRSYVYVKAVDKAGNERVAVVEPRYPLKLYEKYEARIIIIVLAGVIVGGAILYGIRKFLWKRHKKQH